MGLFPEKYLNLLELGFPIQNTVDIIGDVTQRTQTGNAKMNYTNAAFNPAKDIIVKWNAERFVIIGDSRKVTNKVLMSLIGGEFPKGWEAAPIF